MFIVSKKNKQDLKYEQYEQYQHIYILVISGGNLKKGS